MSRFGQEGAAAGGPAPWRSALCGLAGGAKKAGGNDLDAKGGGSELGAIFEAASVASSRISN